MKTTLTTLAAAAAFATAPAFAGDYDGDLCLAGNNGNVTTELSASLLDYLPYDQGADEVAKVRQKHFRGEAGTVFRRADGTISWPFGTNRSW